MEHSNQFESPQLKEKGFKRVPKPLVVYEAILKFGPISHDELYHKIGFSRSATFRALRHLETAGWVRRLINNHQYVATAHIDKLVSNGSTSLIELDAIYDVLSGLNFGSRFKFNVGFYVTKRTFCILESSSKFEPLNIVKYPFESCSALVAYCHLYQDWDDKILFNTELHYNSFDRADMKNRLLHCRYDLKRKGYYFCPREVSVSIGLKVDSTLVGSITLKCKNISKVESRELISNIRAIQFATDKRGFLASL